MSFEELIRPHVVRSTIDQLFGKFFAQHDHNAFFSSSFEWLFEVTHKISAQNLVKEIFLPLIMAYNSANDIESHYFDLSVFMWPANQIINLTETESLKIPEVCRDISWQKSIRDGRLPRWPHIRVPIKSIPTCTQEFFHATIMAKDRSDLNTLIMELSIDVWWLYSTNNLISIRFFIQVFLNILKEFLISFPNVKQIISRQIVDENIFLQSPPILNSEALSFKKYLTNLLICRSLSGPASTTISEKRAKLIARFWHSYNSALTWLLLSEPRMNFGIFSLCICLQELNFIFPQSSLPDIELKKQLRRTIANITKSEENAFTSRFLNSETLTYYDLNMGYFKNVAGGWQIPIISNLESEWEREILNRYQKFLFPFFGTPLLSLSRRRPRGSGSGQ